MENDVHNGVGSMAFEDKHDYAKVDHDHDDIYSRLEPGERREFPVSASYRLMTVHLSNFLEDGTVVNDTFDIVAPSSTAVSDEPVGTLRFVGIPKLNRDNVVRYGDKYNIDISADDFDGWVYPNGTTFEASEDEFPDACRTYGNGSGFTVPDLSSFVKLNPGVVNQDSAGFHGFSNGVPEHSHEIRDISLAVSPTKPVMSVGLGSNAGNSCVCGWGNQNKPVADI